MADLLTTENVDVRERFDFWHEVICSAFVRLEAERLLVDEPFQGSITGGRLGPLMLTRVSARPHAVRRSADLIDSEPRNEVLISLQLSGVTIVSQGGREAVLRPGDFALYDATQPYELTMPGDFDQLVLQFDRKFLLERCPSPQALTAIRMPSTGQVTAPVSSFLRSLEPVVGVDEAVSRQLATNALDLVGLALASQFGDEVAPGATRTKHFLRACTYINAHADDFDLDPSAIAKATGVSLRYLHQLFRENDTTVNTYLLRRRLARCKDDLVNVGAAQRTITEIACAHGFKTGAHFSRWFSEVYEMTPSDFRRAALSGEPTTDGTQAP
jgi:AraC-like DNA-binding protein